jgi:hypothetical protein
LASHSNALAANFSGVSRVLNIPADGSPAIIPIDAKLAVKQPQVFVITLEQPAGVVKSKQDTVVAIAKR